MSNRIFFIHGLFLNPKSWEQWIDYFEKRDFSCQAPAWPLHEGDPKQLRVRIPEGLGRLGLQDVVDKMAAEIQRPAGPDDGDQPVLIGQGLGGLVVQILAAQGYASMGICIGSVPPHELVETEEGQLKTVAAFADPKGGTHPFEMTPECFHDAICNTMSHAAAIEAFDELAVHDSRQVARDSFRRPARLDLTKPHVPLLFVSGDKDSVVPTSLVHRNADAYTDMNSISDFHVITGRGHFLCNQPGWEDVASFIHRWILAQSDLESAARLDQLSIEGDENTDPASRPIIRRYLTGEDPPPDEG